MRPVTGLMATAWILMNAQPALSQSRTEAPRHEGEGARGESTPPEIEKCMNGDHYGCVVTLKKDRSRLSRPAIACIEDLEVQGMDDSHPMATPECRNLILGH